MCYVHPHFYSVLILKLEACLVYLLPEANFSTRQKNVFRRRLRYVQYSILFLLLEILHSLCLRTMNELPFPY
jgi:hypothetical protein